MGKRHSRQFWRGTVAEYEESDLAAGVFAGRRGLNANTLKWWAGRFRRERRLSIAEEPAGFVEVTSAEVPMVLAETREPSRAGAVVTVRVVCGVLVATRRRRHGLDEHLEPAVLGGRRRGDGLRSAGSGFCGRRVLHDGGRYVRASRAATPSLPAAGPSRPDAANEKRLDYEVDRVLGTHNQDDQGLLVRREDICVIGAAVRERQVQDQQGRRQREDVETSLQPQEDETGAFER